MRFDGLTVVVFLSGVAAILLGLYFGHIAKKAPETKVASLLNRSVFLVLGVILILVPFATAAFIPNTATETAPGIPIYNTRTEWPTLIYRTTVVSIDADTADANISGVTVEVVSGGNGPLFPGDRVMVLTSSSLHGNLSLGQELFISKAKLTRKLKSGREDIQMAWVPVGR